jgi:hypothetical protein
MISHEPRAKNLESLPSLWARLSAVTAFLGAAGSAIGLLAAELIHGRETLVLFMAAIAQDLVNLFLVAPLIVILTVRASLAFTAYNYAIYAFSIHFALRSVSRRGGDGTC